MKKLFTKNVMVTALLVVLFISGAGLVFAVECLDAGTFDLNNSKIVYISEDPNDVGGE